MTGKEKLIAALRSGHYRQIRYSSRDGEDGYCATALASHLGIDLEDDEALVINLFNDSYGLAFSEIADELEAEDFPYGALQRHSDAADRRRRKEATG
jgi:hypothetical protein